jgi:IS5 family transposase
VRPDADDGQPRSGNEGHPYSTGTIVDATIIHAPSSTKNSSGERDPAMHQTRKGKQ